VLTVLYCQIQRVISGHDAVLTVLYCQIQRVISGRSADMMQC